MQVGDSGAAVTGYETSNNHPDRRGRGGVGTKPGVRTTAIATKCGNFASKEKSLLCRTTAPNHPAKPAPPVASIFISKPSAQNTLNQRCFLARGEKMKSFQHGGDVRRLAQSAGLKEHELLDFSANINPLGPPEWLRPVISSQVSALQHYPDPHCAALVEAAAVRYGVAQDEVIAGNGSTEILYLLARAAGKSTALIPVPCYGDYSKAALQAGMKVRTIQEGRDLPVDLLTPDTIAFIGRPNNPTGSVCSAEVLRAVASQHPSTLFLVDEAFGDFVEDFDSLTVRRPANVVVLLVSHQDLRDSWLTHGMCYRRSSSHSAAA